MTTHKDLGERARKDAERFAREYQAGMVRATLADVGAAHTIANLLEMGELRLARWRAARMTVKAHKVFCAEIVDVLTARGDRA